LQNLAHVLDRHTELFPELFRRRLTTDLVEHLPPRAHDLVDGLVYVNGHTDGAGLIVEPAADRLPNPPGRVGRELVTTSIVELVDCLHYADVAFLDQVENWQAAVDVFLCD